MPLINFELHENWFCESHILIEGLNKFFSHFCKIFYRFGINSLQEMSTKIYWVAKFGPENGPILLLVGVNQSLPVLSILILRTGWNSMYDSWIQCSSTLVGFLRFVAVKSTLLIQAKWKLISASTVKSCDLLKEHEAFVGYGYYVTQQYHFKFHSLRKHIDGMRILVYIIQWEVYKMSFECINYLLCHLYAGYLGLYAGSSGRAV
jgi:hypothetical protein